MLNHARRSNSDDLKYCPVSKELPKGQLFDAELLHHIWRGKAGLVNRDALLTQSVLNDKLIDKYVNASEGHIYEHNLFHFI